MKVNNVLINPKDVESCIKALADASSNHTDYILNLNGKIKALAFGVFALSCAVILLNQTVFKQEKKIKTLEKTVDTLVQIQVSGNQDKKEEPASE